MTEAEAAGEMGVWVAATYLTGDALHWYNEHYEAAPFASYNDLCERLSKAFGVTDASEAARHELLHNSSKLWKGNYSEYFTDFSLQAVCLRDMDTVNV